MANSYGVLVGTIHEGREDPASDKTPHYEIWIEAGGNYRAAVNVRSSDQSNLLAFIDQSYTPPAALDLAGLAAGTKGFRALTTGTDGNGLDYIRGNLFDLSKMVAIPATGGDTSLSDTFSALVAKAQADADAVILVYGMSYSDKGRDETFGFTPSPGIHDVHMMQGNSGSYADENTVHGDGALFVHFGDGTNFAFFARFDTQSVTTDPTTGAPTA